MCLSELSPGQCATINHLDDRTQMKRRFEDLGMIKGTDILCELRSPLGEPQAYRVRGTLIALRKQDADCIIVEEV